MPTYTSVNWVSMASDNGLLPIRHQANIWTNAGSLSIGHLRRNFKEIFYQNTKLFINKNAPENIICEMVAILSKGRWVDRNKNCWLFIQPKNTTELNSSFLLVGETKTETVHQTKILSEKWKMRKLPILDCIPSITPNHWSNQNHLESPSEDWWSLGHQRGNLSPGMGGV